MTVGQNLLSEPPSTLLPENPQAADLLDKGVPVADVAALHPTYSVAWSLLAQEAYDNGRIIEAYAYARTGYHRGLDALRRNGWKGFGSVPWSHQPNRGVLRCIYILGQAANSINEEDEAARCGALLDDSDPAARAALEPKR